MFPLRKEKGKDQSEGREIFGGELSTGSWDALYLAACHLGRAAGTLLWLCSPKRARDAAGRDGLFLGGEVPRGGRAFPGRAPPRAGVLRKKKNRGLLSQIKACLAKVMAILQLELEIFTWQWDPLRRGVPI